MPLKFVNFFWPGVVASRALLPVLRIRDSGSGAFLTPGSGIGKKSGSGSGMNNPDHISESLETIFWVKILLFFDEDPGSGMEKKIRFRDPGRKNSDQIWKKFESGIRDKHPGSATLPIALSDRLPLKVFMSNIYSNKLWMAPGL